MDRHALRCRLVSARGQQPKVEVAKALGISVSALSMYELGERVPRDEIKEQMAKYYGLTVGFLFFGEEVHETRTVEAVS